MNKNAMFGMPDGVRSVFFIGIGGVSMSSLAAICAKNGFRTGGSDRTESEVTKRLRESGIEIFIGHSEENVKGYDAVVYTAAIPENNPELSYAKAHGLPVIYRADCLGSLMLGYETRIGVAGMHGKSTATGLISHLFIECGTDPTVLNGAEVRELEGGAYRIGADGRFIFEACEYKDSFLSFHPSTAVVLNIEMDHVDYFKSMEQIKKSFREYINKAEKAVVNFDDKNVADCVAGYKGELHTFGRGEGAEYRIKSVSETEKGFSKFVLSVGGKTDINVVLSIPGEHNVYNAAAAIAAAAVNGIDVKKAAAAVSSFKGVARRNEYRATVNGVDVYDDYAHHPSEIKASLAGLRRIAERKLICVYQPHTYSRTAGLFDEFAAAFSDADETVFADIYAARETNVYGVSSKALSEKVSGSKYFSSFEEIADYLKKTAVPGDLIVVMGAGDIIKLTDLLTGGGRVDPDK